MRERPVPNKIVKPRKLTTVERLPIIAVSVSTNSYLTEEGECGVLTDLFPLLRSRPETIFACDNSGSFLAQCQSRFQFDPTWQYGASELRRQVYSPTSRLRIYDIGVAVTFFGWRNSNTGGRSGKRRNDYHVALDPQTFAGARNNLPLRETLEWAQEIRDFCVTEGLQLRPTGGAVARQLLRDSRFYPEPRRKVPRATNERARVALPGNYYKTRTETGKEYEAHYLDQEKCHHYHASTLDLPDSDSLRAHGNFKTLSGLWRKEPERVRSFMRRFHGLLLLEIYWPRKQRNSDMFLPPFLESYLRIPDQGPIQVYVWTCETDMLAYFGVHVRGIVAAWGSYKTDTGLRSYAKWAMEQTPTPVIKPLLLSVYGTLATAARKRRVIFAKTNSKKAQPIEIRVPGGVLTGMVVQTNSATEPSTNNVIQRGMIEAATRCECIMLAEILRREGYNVLAIYADSVFVEHDLSEPTLGEIRPWRNKHRLARLEFLSPNAFTAYDADKKVTLAKVPGGLDRRLGHNPRARPLQRKLHDRAGTTANSK